jgi:hypothetical protein
VVSTELAQAADTADLVVLGRGGLHTRLSHALLRRPSQTERHGRSDRRTVLR